VEGKFSDYVSFLNGNSGIYAIAAVIYDSMGDSVKTKFYISQIE
jgi:hypothetical protein